MKILTWRQASYQLQEFAGDAECGEATPLAETATAIAERLSLITENGTFRKNPPGERGMLPRPISLAWNLHNHVERYGCKKSAIGIAYQRGLIERRSLRALREVAYADL